MPEANAGPTLSIDTETDKCHRCGGALTDRAVHHRDKVRGYDFWLCLACEQATRNPPPPQPNAEANLFGPALNRAMQLRTMVASGLDAEEAASFLASLCRDYAKRTALIPALAYVTNPARLLDTFLPNPPNTEWRTRCEAKLVGLLR